MRRYGLIGKSLKHSFSPGYFTRKFREEGIRDTRYDAFEINSAKEMLDLFDQGIQGLNVTIPFKERVLPFLDECHISAREAAAVNVIKSVDGKLTGYNTDVYGFGYSLRNDVSILKDKKALVLGTGGASKAVCIALEKLNMLITQVSSSGKARAYEELTRQDIEDSALIVNATPLGMFPETGTAPAIPYHFLSGKQLVYDLIYNPEKTLFLARAEAQSARTKNGMEMLINQAEKSWEIWNNTIDLEMNFEWM